MDLIRNSFAMNLMPSSVRICGPSRMGCPICSGDRIFVRLVRVQYGVKTLAELTLTNVSDLSQIFGELRHYTRGERGLTRLYIRNLSRGWSVEQPFMLYDQVRRERVAKSMEQANKTSLEQPAKASRQGKREIPESIRLLFGEH